MTDSKMRLGGVFTLWCIGKDGDHKWTMTASNLVVNEGLTHVLDTVLIGSSQITDWYIGLTDGSPTPASGDTLASHGGWTEADEYSEGARQAYSGVRSDQTVSNSASKATFSINGSATIGGAFLCSASSGTSGTLLAVAAADGGNKSVTSGDTILATYAITAADA